MKLGEALTARANSAQRLNDLQGRIKDAALVQEGDSVGEECETLITEYLRVSSEHALLVGRIQLTNALTKVGDENLLGILQRREVLVRQRNIYRIAAKAASPGANYRYMRTEIRYIPQIPVQLHHEMADETEVQIRVLDSKIQQINWTTELLA